MLGQLGLLPWCCACLPTAMPSGCLAPPANAPPYPTRRNTLIVDAPDARGFRLTELVAAISLATDLGTGQPVEHALRTCLLSTSVAKVLGLDATTTADVHYVALLRFLGCVADAPDIARLTGGDNIAFLSDMAPSAMGNAGEEMRALAHSLGRSRSRLRRGRLLVRALSDPGWGRRSLSAHCEVGARLAARLGLGSGVVDALAHAYERWDGRGRPDGLAAEEIPIAVRVVVVARDALLWQRLAGSEAASAVLTRRRGRAYDPAVVDALQNVGLGTTESDSPWQDVLEAEPAPVRRIEPAELDEALAAVGDFADLRSTRSRGRSSRVAELAAAAGRASGVSAEEIIALRRAGMVADVGAVGVPAEVWGSHDPTGAEVAEQVRLHPYLSERILNRCTGLTSVALLAGAHHERLDGSGYHRGSTGPQLSIPARLLAAADLWASLDEQRSSRSALTPAQARTAIRAEARAGRVDAAAVEAVLAAAGQGGDRARSARPAGLSDREIEVLRLVARGSSNRDVAAYLSISAKTVGRHVENIYAKAGVRSRAAAALFAMEHRLLD